MLEGGPAVALSEYKPVANSCGLMWLQTLKYIEVIVKCFENLVSFHAEAIYMKGSLAPECLVA